MVRFVHQEIGIQSRFAHDSVDQIVYYGSDAIDATKSVVERGLLCWLHDESPSGVVVYQNGIRGHRSRVVAKGRVIMDRHQTRLERRGSIVPTPLIAGKTNS